MTAPVLDAAAIEALIPHRAPMRFVDRVLTLEPGTRAVAVHDVPAEPFWAPGHFPAEPVMPGVLIAEALAQAAAVAWLSAAPPEGAPPVLYLVGYDKLRFRQPVRPGATLDLHVALERARRRLATFQAEARVGEDRVASGTLLATLPG